MEQNPELVMLRNKRAHGVVIVIEHYVVNVLPE